MEHIRRAIEEIEAQIADLDQAKRILQGVVGVNTAAAPNNTPVTRRGGARRMSPEARKRIGEASRRRWAAIRAEREAANRPATKKAAKKTIRPVKVATAGGGNA